MHESDPREFVYHLDADDRLVGVSAEWLDFARENGAEEIGGGLLGRPLWEFIRGIETQSVYRALFRTVRAQGVARTLPMRCDSPDERRFLQLEVRPLAHGGLELVGRIVRREVRAHQSLLDPIAPRKLPPLELCSFCKRVRLNGVGWVEVDEVDGRISSLDAQPELEHGLCDSCAAGCADRIDEDL